jgi:hypothetical protein
VDVTLDTDLSVMPTDASCSKGAFHYLPAATIHLPADASPEALGDAIREAFKRCK